MKIASMRWCQFIIRVNTNKRCCITFNVSYVHFQIFLECHRIQQLLKFHQTLHKYAVQFLLSGIHQTTSTAYRIQITTSFIPQQHQQPAGCRSLHRSYLNNINSLQDIDHYIVRTSSQSEMHTVNETSTLAAFLSPCMELKSFYINITAVDRCECVGVTTANFTPSFQASISTTSTPVPCEFYL